MDNRTIENRLHLFEDVASDNHDTIYEVAFAFSDLCKLLSQKGILTANEFDSVVNKRRYHLPTETKPVIHAHWVEFENPNYSPFDNSPEKIVLCSHCNNGHGTKDDYCCVCGAKMDEEVK